MLNSQSDAKESRVQENTNNHSVVASGNFVNAVIPMGTTTSITKTKGKVIATQNKSSTKIGATVLMSSNVSPVSGNNLQPDTHVPDTSTQDSLSKKQHDTAFLILAYISANQLHFPRYSRF